MALDPQVPVTTLKQFWMRVSFRDAVKLGFGFGIGVTAATIVISLGWYLIAFIFGIAIYAPKTGI